MLCRHGSQMPSSQAVSSRRTAMMALLRRSLRSVKQGCARTLISGSDLYRSVRESYSLIRNVLA